MSFSPPRPPREVSTEFLGIQAVLERTTDELDDTRSALREMEARYKQDTAAYKENIQIIGQERNELKSLQAVNASREFKHGSLEAEEAVRRLEYQYKCKAQNWTLCSRAWVKAMRLHSTTT